MYIRDGIRANLACNNQFVKHIFHMNGKRNNSDEISALADLLFNKFQHSNNVAHQREPSVFAMLICAFVLHPLPAQNNSGECSTQ